MGGAYVGPTQRRVARLVNELSLDFCRVNVKERTLMSTEVNETMHPWLFNIKQLVLFRGPSSQFLVEKPFPYTRFI